MNLVMRFDIHVHTDLSACSELSIEEILEQARIRGLDGVCITDHESIAVRARVAEGLQADGLCLIFGMEYSTSDGDFLLFGPVEDLPLGLKAEDLLPRFASLGGAAVAAHPFRTTRPTSDFLVRDGLCSIAEGINGRNREIENLRSQAWRTRYGVKLTGGSDAHSLAELGRVVTCFETPIRGRDEFVKALHSGRFSPARAIEDQPKAANGKL